MSEATFQLGQKALILNERDEVLIVGMRKRNNPDVISWDLPGGRVDEDESNLIDALNREMQEELCVSVAVHDLLTLSIAKSGPNDRLNILLAVYRCSIISGEPKPSNEILEYKWIHINELGSMPTSRYEQSTVDKIKDQLNIN